MIFWLFISLSHTRLPSFPQCSTWNIFRPKLGIRAICAKRQQYFSTVFHVEQSIIFLIFVSSSAKSTSAFTVARCYSSTDDVPNLQNHRCRQPEGRCRQDHYRHK